jgi:Tol biopolymer transport system component
MRSNLLKSCLCFTLLCGLWVAAAAQTAPRPLTINDIFNLELATDPQISPDGKRIVYVRQFADIMSDKHHSRNQANIVTTKNRS